MGSEFKYRDEKVLGTQPHPTHGLASTYCVLHLNPIKGLFNIAYTYVSNKYMFMMLTKSKVYDLSILITYFTNMIFKENNGNAIIMKCYVKV